jgi:hypothetical protein
VDEHSNASTKAQAATCCQRGCEQQLQGDSTYAYDLGQLSVAARVMGSSDMDLTPFSCPSAVIMPSYLGICVCDPADPSQSECEWSAPEPAEVRLRLFIQVN